MRRLAPGGPADRLRLFLCRAKVGFKQDPEQGVYVHTARRLVPNAVSKGFAALSRFGNWGIAGKSRHHCASMRTHLTVFMALSFALAPWPLPERNSREHCFAVRLVN